MVMDRFTRVIVVMASCSHMSKHQLISFKYMQFTVCQLQLNKTV